MTASLLYFELKMIYRVHIVYEGKDIDEHHLHCGSITEYVHHVTRPQPIGRYLALSGRKLGPVKLSHMVCRR